MKEQNILLACKIKSKITFILHCRNTRNELDNKANCYGSTQASKHTATFCGS